MAKDTDKITETGTDVKQIVRKEPRDRCSQADRKYRALDFRVDDSQN
jgi:hypothetical protein